MAAAAAADPACATGTDRVHAALRARRAAIAGAAAAVTAAQEEEEEEHGIVVNLQGDEPLASPDHIDLLVESMRRKCARARENIYTEACASKTRARTHPNNPRRPTGPARP